MSGEQLLRLAVQEDDSVGDDSLICLNELEKRQHVLRGVLFVVAVGAVNLALYGILLVQGVRHDGGLHRAQVRRHKVDSLVQSITHLIVVVRQWMEDRLNAVLQRGLVQVVAFEREQVDGVHKHNGGEK